MYEQSVPTSQEAHYVSVTKTNLLTLFWGGGGLKDVYIVKHTKNTNER
jgi:hypothetical protein